MSRFLRDPVSVRNAVSVIAGGTVTVVVAGAVLMRVIDHSEYPDIGRGLWWAVQTVTTIGYGDVTPAHTSGRIVAAIVMLWGVAFLAVLTAAITSTFVTRAAREYEQADAVAEESADQTMNARFDDLTARLDRVEQMLTQLTKS